MSSGDYLIGKELKSLKKHLKNNRYSEALKLELIGELIKTIEFLEKNCNKQLKEHLQKERLPQ